MSLKISKKHDRIFIDPRKIALQKEEEGQYTEETVVVVNDETGEITEEKRVVKNEDFHPQPTKQTTTSQPSQQVGGMMMRNTTKVSFM